MTDTRTLTPEEIAELRRIAEAATPGPWSVHLSEDAEERWVSFGGTGDDSTLPSSRDAAHIAAFNPAMALRLLDRLADVEQKLARPPREVFPRFKAGGYGAMVEDSDGKYCAADDAIAGIGYWAQRAERAESALAQMREERDASWKREAESDDLRDRALASAESNFRRAEQAEARLAQVRETLSHVIAQLAWCETETAHGAETVRYALDIARDGLGGDVEVESKRRDCGGLKSKCGHCGVRLSAETRVCLTADDVLLCGACGESLLAAEAPTPTGGQ